MHVLFYNIGLNIGIQHATNVYMKAMALLHGVKLALKNITTSKLIVKI